MNSISAVKVQNSFGESETPSINEVVEALKERCSWIRLRDALKKDELETGTGWADLLKNAEGVSDSAAALNIFLREFYAASLLAGSRYVQLYNVDESVIKRIVAILKDAVIQPSVFSSRYPLPIARKQVPSAPSDPTLTAISPLPKGDIALIYCSSRSYEERHTYVYNQLSPLVQDVYTGIDELITIKKVFFQAFDLITIRPSLNRIEVCIDRPEKSTNDLQKLALSILSAAVNNIPTMTPVYQSDPMNVFDAISGIFEDKHEGIVHRLSFRTLTGSTKTERMARKNDDLRAEKFHEAGMEAVDHKVRPHVLHVKWEFNFPSESAELKLLASVRDLSSENPKLPGCYIEASAHSSFLKTVNKVVKYT